MFKLTLRSLLDRKIRLALTTFAVVLGVAFVSGAFILADSLRATFDDVAEEIAGPINVQVRGIEAFEGDETTRTRVPDSLITDIEAVDGVARADGFIQGFPRVSVGDELVDPGQAPTLAFNYTGGDEASSFTLLRGEAPGTGEVLVDVDTADNYEVDIGDTLTVRSLAAPEDFVVAGIVTFGEDNGAGAAFVLFDTETTQRLFEYEGSFMVVNVVSEAGVTEEELAASLNTALPADFEAVTGATVANEFSDAFGEFITIFQNALLGFAFVALIVSAFIINNTFSIVLGQRIKELALLRTLGATGRQVRTSVLVEAIIIGVIASVTGVLAGIVVASAIKWLNAQSGGGDG